MHKLIFFIAISFSMALLFSSCSNDPKPLATNEAEMYTPEQMSQSEELATASPAQIAVDEKTTLEAVKAEEAAALAEAKKAREKLIIEKEEKEAAAKKERRRKRREARKAKEAAAAKAKAKQEAKLAADNKQVDAYDKSSSILKEDLSDVDPELLDIVQVKNTGGAPKIRFDSDTYDFGRIIEGKEIDHRFTFTNTGSAPLVIKDVKVTCGCTTPFYPFIPIEPGKTGVISVHFSSKGRLGNQKPTITVFTNAEPDKYELYLKGVIDTEREGGE